MFVALIQFGIVHIPFDKVNTEEQLLQFPLESYERHPIIKQTWLSWLYVNGIEQLVQIEFV